MATYAHKQLMVATTHYTITTCLHYLIESNETLRLIVTCILPCCWAVSLPSCPDAIYSLSPNPILFGSGDGPIASVPRPQESVSGRLSEVSKMSACNVMRVLVSLDYSVVHD